MTLTFEQIGEFFSNNIVWFLIPINLAIITFGIILTVKVIRTKRSKKHEGKRQNKSNKTPKKARKL